MTKKQRKKKKKQAKNKQTSFGPPREETWLRA